MKWKAVGIHHKARQNCMSRHKMAQTNVSWNRQLTFENKWSLDKKFKYEIILISRTIIFAFLRTSIFRVTLCNKKLYTVNNTNKYFKEYLLNLMC